MKDQTTAKDVLTKDGYKKRLTKDEYLKAFALFVMANDHYVKSIDFAAAMYGIIRPGNAERYPGGHLDDATYAHWRATLGEFQAALKLDGIEVEDAS